MKDRRVDINAILIKFGNGFDQPIKLSSLVGSDIVLTQNTLVLGKMTIDLPEDVPTLLRYLADKLEGHFSGKTALLRDRLYP